MCIDADGERDAILVQKRFERHGGHGVVMFEHAVEPEHGDIVAEGVLDPLGLRYPVGDAAGTEHLKRLNYHNMAAEAS